MIFLCSVGIYESLELKFLDKLIFCMFMIKFEFMFNPFPKLIIASSHLEFFSELSELLKGSEIVLEHNNYCS